MQGACVAVLAVATGQKASGIKAFTHDDSIFAQGFADQVAHAVAGAMWRRKTELSEKQQLLKADMADVASGSVSVGQLGDGLASLLCRTFEAEATSVLMVDHESRSLRRVGYCDKHGTTADDDDGGEPPMMKMDQGICGYAISRPPQEYLPPSRGILRNNDVSASGVFDPATDHEVSRNPRSDEWEVSVHVSSIMVVPLLTGEGHAVGVLKVMNALREDGFTKDDQAIIAAAQDLACRQLTHVATYETSVTNSRKDREMLDVACELMQSPSLQACPNPKPDPTRP